MFSLECKVYHLIGRGSLGLPLIFCNFETTIMTDSQISKNIEQLAYFWTYFIVERHLYKDVCLPRTVNEIAVKKSWAIYWDLIGYFKEVFENLEYGNLGLPDYALGVYDYEPLPNWMADLFKKHDVQLTYGKNSVGFYMCRFGNDVLMSRNGEVDTIDYWFDGMKCPFLETQKDCEEHFTNYFLNKK